MIETSDRASWSTRSMSQEERNGSKFSGSVEEYSEFEVTLLETLTSLASELGKTPTARELRDLTPHDATTYHHHFGSWNRGVSLAGLEPHRGGTSKNFQVEDDDLLQALRDFASALGKTPTKREMCKTGPYSTQTYENHFGSWNGAIRAAGLDIVCPGPDDRTAENNPNWNGGSLGYYGPNWVEMRRRRLSEDDSQCLGCGIGSEEHISKYGRALHIHHRTPMKEFRQEDGSYDFARANSLENLATLCVKCHNVAERMAPLFPFG